MENIGALRMSSLSKEMADIFEEESDNDKTFYGFSDSEISDLCDIKGSDSDDAAVKSEQTTPKQTMPKRPPAYRFRLRVALRPRTPAGYRSEEEEDGSGDDADDGDDDEEKVEYNDKEEWGVKVKKEKVKPEIKEKPVTKATQKEKVKPEIEEKPLSKETQPQQSGSESETDGPQSFLAKRAQNIKANKAMLAQLMADLHKMPGALLKNHGGAGKRKKEKGSRPPRSAVATGESRRNPERTSRRQTRSMGGCEDPSTPPERELELSLEDELLEVRGEPRRRGNPRPNQGKPHVVRLVEEITEDELQLVADNMTEKIYNRATGSTCHQCRQKTTDTKTCCRSTDCRGIMGQFCGPCLRNRYGEDVKKALLDPEWQCPPCRGICNCSFCRARDGRCPTGILFPLAQYHGFSDVHSYLSSLRSKLKTGEEDEDL